MAFEYEIRGPVRTCLDGHGQPLVAFPGQHLNNAAKALEELSSICTGILCDDEITDKEATFFRNWVERHHQFSNIAWFRDMRSRVESIFNDGQIDNDERQELRAIMEQIRGGSDIEALYSSPLPLDDPQPDPVEFPDRKFCITGKFAFGKRSKVAEAIISQGGFASDSQPAQYTNYLVIGTFCSRDWKEQSYGTKIARAVELRTQGHPVQIICEEHWRKFISSGLQNP